MKVFNDFDSAFVMNGDDESKPGYKVFYLYPWGELLINDQTFDLIRKPLLFNLWLWQNICWFLNLCIKSFKTDISALKKYFSCIERTTGIGFVFEFEIQCVDIKMSGPDVFWLKTRVCFLLRTFHLQQLIAWAWK